MIERHYEREEWVLIYGYCVGVFSSRPLEKRLVEDIGFRVLATFRSGLLSELLDPRLPTAR